MVPQTAESGRRLLPFPSIGKGLTGVRVLVLGMLYTSRFRGVDQEGIEKIEGHNSILLHCRGTRAIFRVMLVSISS